MRLPESEKVEQELDTVLKRLLDLREVLKQELNQPEPKKARMWHLPKRTPHRGSDWT